MRSLVLVLVAAVLVGHGAAYAADKPAKATPPATKAAPDPLVGLFKGDDLTADIQAAGPGAYKGTLTMNGQKLPFTAKKAGPGITGTFVSAGEKYEFVAKLNGEGLELTSADTAYKLRRDAPAKPPNRPDPLVGVFKGKELTAEIQAAGADGYKGTLILNGQRLPFTAKKDGPGIAGTFESGGEKYEFTARLDGDALELKSDDNVYMLGRDVPAKPVNRPDPLVGVFKGKELTAEIQAFGVDGYNGTLILNGRKLPFTAMKDGTGVAGTFESGGEKYAFTAKLDGEKLQLKSDDAVYDLTRDSPAKVPNPLTNKPAEPAPTGKPLDPKTAALLDPGWKVVRHPIGLSLRYPKDWDYKELEGDDGYQLLPPNAAPDELYILGSYPSEGIRTATDPRVAQSAEAVMLQIAPALRRVGQAETLKAGETPVVGLTWEGGPNGRARMYLIVLKDQIIGLTGIGAKEKVAAREGMLRKIFTSFSQNEGQRDPQLVGAWNRTGTTDLSARDAVGRVQVSSVGERRRTLTLRADGTCTSREVSRTIAIGQGVAVDTGDQVTTKNGKWFAGDGTLVLMWEKDAEEYGYKLVGGKQLVFELDKSRGLVWEPAR